MRIAIPVKSFSEAKQRLAPALDTTARATLARDLFRHVFSVALEFAGPERVFVISRSAEILELASTGGATALAEAGSGLNPALVQAQAHAREAGAARLLVLASDLPLLGVADLVELSQHACAIAPDRHGRGTNALLWPTHPAPGFHFGEDSFGKHRAAAEQCGFNPAIVDRPGLGHDVDYPADLALLAARLP